jgi:hypothetical protein
MLPSARTGRPLKGAMERVWKNRFSFVATGFAPFVISLLLNGCVSSVFGPQGDLPVPPVDQVRTESEDDRGLAISLVVGDVQDAGNNPHLRVGDFVPVFVKVTNHLNDTVGLWAMDMGDPERAFALWLFRDGEPVSRTPYGESMSNRQYLAGWAGNAFGPPLRHGETRYSLIRLSALFRLEEPGTYTLIAEPAPVFVGTPVQKQMKSSVKVNFDLDPEYVNFRGFPLLTAPSLFPQSHESPTTDH